MLGAFEQRRALPRADGRFGRRRWGRVAQELLDRGSDRGGLLGRRRRPSQLDAGPGRMALSVARHDAGSVLAVPKLPVFDSDTVLGAISPAEAIERVRQGFVEYAAG